MILSERSVKTRLILSRAFVLMLTLVIAAAFCLPDKAYAASKDLSSGIDAASMSDTEFQQYLYDQGCKALMIGAVVTGGDDAEKIKRATADFREVIEGL